MATNLSFANSRTGQKLNPAAIALTTAEESVTIAAAAPGRGSNPAVTVVGSVDWLYDSASGGLDADRVPVKANTFLPLRLDGDQLVFYAKLAAGSGSLFVIRAG